jgi:hypothetical protein
MWCPTAAQQPSFCWTNLHNLKVFNSHSWRYGQEAIHALIYVSRINAWNCSTSIATIQRGEGKNHRKREISLFTPTSLQNSSYQTKKLRTTYFTFPSLLFPTLCPLDPTFSITWRTEPGGVWNSYVVTGVTGRAVAQVVSCRLRAQVRSCGICGGTGVGLLRIFRFSLPILFPPTASHSSSIIRGWYNRPVSSRRTKWTQSHPTPRKKPLKITEVIDAVSKRMGYCTLTGTNFRILYKLTN